MEKERLDKVMQDILHIDYGTKIYCNQGTAQKPDIVTYFYDETGLNCISHKQGYRADYVIIGMLLENDSGIRVVDAIDYKQCWNSMRTFLETNKNCESLTPKILLGNMKVWEEESKNV